MKRAGVLGPLILAAAITAMAALAVSFASGGEPFPPRPASKRPVLLLLTSLPLVFGEDFSLQATGSPALQALETRYRVVLISVTDPAELKRGSLLLMAQPFAQPAEDLVALDQWVRRGGRVLLLADPILEWPSKRPLGDQLRPPAMFMDTGLLAHWGLRLDPPDERGPRSEELGGFTIEAVSSGALSGRGNISRNRLVAHCAVGKGRATVIADADLLNVADLGPQGAHNLDGILEELADLER